MREDLFQDAKSLLSGREGSVDRRFALKAALGVGYAAAAGGVMSQTAIKTFTLLLAAVAGVSLVVGGVVSAVGLVLSSSLFPHASQAQQAPGGAVAQAAPSAAPAPTRVCTSSMKRIFSKT